MKAILQFFRTTLVGGVLFLIPVILIVLLLHKALGVVSKLLHPIAEQIPRGPLSGPVLAYILAAIALLLIGFVAGLIARTEFGLALGQRIEHFVLRKVPGFTLVKSMAQGSLGTPSDQAIKVAFAFLDEVWVLAFIIEQSEDGLLTVFVPSAPTPTGGSLYFMREDQVRRVDIPLREAIQCIMQLGVGSRALLARARLGDEARS